MTFFRGNPPSKDDPQVRHRAGQRRRRLRFETLEQRYLMAVDRIKALSNILDQYVVQYDTQPESFESQEAFLDAIAPYRLARALAQSAAITDTTASSQPLNETYRLEAIAQIDALLESAPPFLDSESLTSADTPTENFASPPTSYTANRWEAVSASEPMVAFPFGPTAVPLQSFELPSPPKTLSRAAEPIPEDRTSAATSQRLDATETNKLVSTNVTEIDPTDDVENGIKNSVEGSVEGNPEQEVTTPVPITLRDSSTFSRDIVSANLLPNYSSDFAGDRLELRARIDSTEALDSSERLTIDPEEEETKSLLFESQLSVERISLAKPRKSEQGGNKLKASEQQHVIDRLLGGFAREDPTLNFPLREPDWEVRYQRVPLSLFQAFDAKSSVANGPYVACNYELWPEDIFNPQDRLTPRDATDRKIVEYGFSQYRHIPMQLMEDYCDGLSDQQVLAHQHIETPIAIETIRTTSSFFGGWSSQSWSCVAVLLATLTTLARSRRTRKESNSSKDYFANDTYQDSRNPMSDQRRELCCVYKPRSRCFNALART